MPSEGSARRGQTAPDFRLLGRSFCLEGTPVAARSFGSGHIHETFRVRVEEAGNPGYILQRLNRRVFPDIPRIMENIVRVTEHMRRRLAAMPGGDPQREVLSIVPARDGASFLLDDDGEYWRCFRFVEHSEPGRRPLAPGRAFEAGRLYGRFLGLLADLPPPPLHETIPRFHDIGRRLADFRQALVADRCGRRREIGAEISFVAERAGAMQGTMDRARGQGLLLRTTHNDTKFGNVLFDGRGRGICVIDLDTVMPGYVLYDFGDAVRSAANLAREDEPDAHAVRFSLETFRELARGYLGELGGALSALETGHLGFSARMMTFLVGLRFLSDHLDGDRYFKTSRPGHNLQRSRAQFALLVEMERRSAEMEGIVFDLAGKGGG